MYITRTCLHDVDHRCKPDDEVPHCTKEMMTELAGSKYCGIITDETGPFSQCLKTLRQVKDGTLSDRAAELFEFCMYDTCEVADRPADVEKMKCDAIAAFKAECESYGVTAIDWRTPELCPSEFFRPNN